MCGILGCLTNKKNFLQKTLNKKILNLLANRGQIRQVISIEIIFLWSYEVGYNRFE